MFAQPPDGFLGKGLIVFNHPGRGGYLARGFQLELPDLSQAQPNVLNQIKDQFGLLFRGFEPHQRLQLQWYCDSDYSAPLDSYDAVTARTDNEWSQFHRREKSKRYRERMTGSKLRRQCLVIFVSRSIEAVPKLRRLDARNEAVLDQTGVEFDHFRQRLVQLFSPHGLRVTPCTDEDHFRLWFRFFNPSLADRPGYDPITTFDPTRPLQENCWLSEATGLADVGFWMDGYYHAMLAVSRWPRTTYPGIIQRLTRLSLLNYQLTLNVEPLSVRTEIQREEQGYRRLLGDLEGEKKIGLERVLEKKQTKVKALMEGFLRPLRAEFIIRTWAKSREVLASQVVCLKQAVNSMNGACYAEPSLPSSSKRLFYQTWPGWSYGTYDHHKNYAEDSYLSDLVPLSTSFTGVLGGAEALFDGPEGSLVGVRTFVGDGPAAGPQHALVLGRTGSGKGVLMIDLLTQTAPYYDFTVVLDLGLSYECFARAIDPEAAPIIIRGNSNVTLNYLDTQGLPITPEHLANATGLVMMMIGNSADDFDRRHRQAVVAKYIQQLYLDVFEDWARAQPEAALEVARVALALTRRRVAQQIGGLDAFVDFRDWQTAHPEEAAAYLGQLDEGQVLEFLKSPVTRKEVCHLAFTRFNPATMPTHQMLQELMELDAASSDQLLARQIAGLLRDWCRHGGHGALFDGVSNVSLTGRMAHFELGQIAHASNDLRSAAAFLVMNHVQRHIMSLSRALRKALIFEEASTFLTMPNGEQIMREAYEQARKYNCWIATVFQGYQRVRESGIRGALMGNARQFFLLAQNDAPELAALAAGSGLSPIATDAINRYPLPGVQQADGYFTYFQRDQPPVCGTSINVVSKEMLYVAGSSGAHFERRRKDFGGDYRNLVQRLQKFAQGHFQKPHFFKQCYS